MRTGLGTGRCSGTELFGGAVVNLDERVQRRSANLTSVHAGAKETQGTQPGVVGQQESGDVKTTWDSQLFSTSGHPWPQTKEVNIVWLTNCQGHSSARRLGSLVLASVYAHGLSPKAPSVPGMALHAYGFQYSPGRGRMAECLRPAWPTW